MCALLITSVRRLSVGVFLSQTLALAQSVPLRAGAPLRSPQAYQKILDNTRKLEVTLTLDRHSYFPNEEIELTVQVRNPTSSILEVLEPLHPSNGQIHLYAHDSGKPRSDPRSWRRVDSGESGPDDVDAPAVWLGAAQQNAKKFLSSDAEHGRAVDAHGIASATICGMCESPEDEGEYEYRYGYGLSGRAGFSVVSPRLEQWTQTRLLSTTQQKDVATGRLLTTVQLIRFAVVGYQASHIIVVSVSPRTGPPPQIDLSGKFSASVSRFFAPFRRIAESATPITSLGAVADPGDNITLTYSDQNGKTYRLKLNSRRDLQP